MPNPFFYGGKITDPTDFVGRESELCLLFDGLNKFSNGQAQHFSIVGKRRIGKSSLLYHLTQIYASRLKAPGKYRFVYVDLDDPHCHTLPGLLDHILKNLKIKAPASPTLEAFYEAIVALRKEGICPVLCLDEFEHLTMRPEEFPVSVYQAWRSLGNNGMADFMTASHHELNQLFDDGSLTSPFPNIFTNLELGELTPEEACQFLERGRRCDRPFTEDEIEQMYALGGRHPYKLQVAGEKIYLAKRSGKVNWQTVRNAFDAQLRQAGLIPDRLPWYKTIWTGLLVFLHSLGRAVLDPRRDKTEISDSTALWWGVVALLVVLAFLLGVIPLSLILKFGSHWLGG